ncbi:MAG: FtsK/SpoIIIE domain-containing protein [Acidimicrobiales bacterium]
MVEQRAGLAESVIGSLIRSLWAWRVELALAGATLLARSFLASRVGSGLASATVILAWVTTLVVPATRRLVIRCLRRARVRRQWSRAVRVAPVPVLAERGTRIVQVREVPAGHCLVVAMPPGARVDDLARSSEPIAAMLAARDVKVTREAANARLASVVIVRRDPLSGTLALSWPHADAERLSLWEPIPIGVGEDGLDRNISLPERNVLLGGEPGAGKSAALSLLVATAALDPEVKLWLFDGKLVELATWAGCAEHSVGVSVSEAIDVLRQLQVEMEHRYFSLLASRRRKVTPGDGNALQVVVCDELAHYLSAPDRKERSEFAELMRDLVSRGRAAGIIVVAATQKPSGDVIPTSLRDLFGFRWAMRCSTPQASDTILGQGWASAGYSAAEIDASCRGVGYLLHEGGQPVRLRAHYLDDDTLLALASRAELVRRGPATEPGRAEVGS